MSNVTNANYKPWDSLPLIIRVASAPGAGDNGGMEQRVKSLENNMVEVRDRLARIETKLEYVATREDLVRVESRLEAKIDSVESRLEHKMSKLESTLIKWFVSTAVALTGLAFAAARWVT